MQEKPNRLLAEKSPYLLQHAYNPVDWYPWGVEPFARAKEEDKPIFLSIGYSTCHWCHVMAHESFEDPEIAKLLNQWFISIKVDREERPDIDQMYMAAIHMITGAGGWPMSVFLLPDGSPFYAGTYYAPQSTSQRPGFSDLLTALHTAWRDRRDEIRQAAGQIVARISTDEEQETSVPDNSAERCFELLAKSYDEKEGGFNGVPKFPRPSVFTFLFDWYRQTGDETARDMALHTLVKMAGGGMYDHLGGGFHRYSVDEKWFVPHFEKMLYDQSQLAHTYLDAFLLTADSHHARVAKEILDYILRDMQAPDGGFYAAEDADSVNPYAPEEHGEGAFYLWTAEQLASLLDPEVADLFCWVYGVEQGGNVSQDPHGEFTGRNILYLAHDVEEAASRYDLSVEEVQRRLAAARQTLLRVRNERIRPHLDDKIITAWNGLMIGALARGSSILDEPVLLEAAERAASFIHKTLFNTEQRMLLRRYRDEEAGMAGQLDDYSCLVSGLLDLYQAIQQPFWLQWAESLTERQIVLFWNDEGGYFYDSVADPTVKVRMRGIYDGAEPTGNSVTAHNLLRLAGLRARDEWRQMALRMMDSFGETIEHYPPALPLLLTAWQQREHRLTQIVVAGERNEADTRELLRIAQKQYDPHRQVLLADGRENQNYLSEKLPFLESVTRLEEKATAYLCSDSTCQPPTQEPEQLKTLLK